jgi:hypothetical protein
MQTYYPNAVARYLVYINSSGTLLQTQNVFFSHALQIALGDLNKDGFLDAVILQNISAVYLLKGNGNGTFSGAWIQITSPVTYNVLYNNVAIADMNADGNNDIVLSSNSASGIAILSGDGNFGLSGNQVISTLTPTYDLSVSDLNGDGRPDLGAVFGTNGNVVISLNLGSGTYASPVTYVTPGAAFGLVSADFTRDGLADLAVANYNGNQVAVLPGTGSGAFGTPTSYVVGPNPSRLVVGDFDGNGQPDLAVTLFAPYSAVVLLNSGCP